MHKCVRCGRVAQSLAEIDAGCPCGSKVFIFGREDPIDTPMQPNFSVSGESAAEGRGAMTMSQPGQGEEAKAEANGPDGKAPASYYARMSFTSEDVENIKVIREGVFLLDVKALSRDPMVLKDEEGVYYVKIPFEQRKPIVPGGKGGNGSNGKK